MVQSKKIRKQTPTSLYTKSKNIKNNKRKKQQKKPLNKKKISDN
jgi:hypothetical protein